MSYKWTAEELRVFTRMARKVERSAGGRRGSQFDPGILLRKLREGFLESIPPPDGGRIHILPSILVREDEDWQDALVAAGPQTPDNYGIRQIGHLYQASGRGDVRKDFVLVRRPGWTLHQFLAWGKIYCLRGTTARDVFAVGREKPTLNQVLQTDPLWVHCSDVNIFSLDLPGMLWAGARRKAECGLALDVGCANGWCLL